MKEKIMEIIEDNFGVDFRNSKCASEIEALYEAKLKEELDKLDFLHKRLPIDCNKPCVGPDCEGCRKYKTNAMKEKIIEVLQKCDKYHYEGFASEIEALYEAKLKEKCEKCIYRAQPFTPY